jgi:tetratricopeptide (TPR) repeat protein
MVRYGLVLGCVVTLAASAGQSPRGENLIEGRNLMAQGQYREAEAKLLDAVRDAQQSRVNQAEVAAYNDLAMLYHLLGRYPEAEAFYLRALRASPSGETQDGPSRLRILNNLAHLYLNRGDVTKAEQACRRAQLLKVQAQEPDSLDSARLLMNLGQIYCARRKYAEGESAYRQALAMWQGKAGADPAEVAAVLGNLAVLYRNAGRPAEAVSEMERAVAMSRTTPQAELGLARRLTFLGELYGSSGRLREAEQVFQEALRVGANSPALAHEYMPELLSSYAAVLRRTNRRTEAKELDARAHRIRRELARQDSARYTVDVGEFVSRK